MINCTGQIQASTTNITFDTSTNFLNIVGDPSVIASFLGAFFSFLFMLLFHKINTYFKDKKELEVALLELNDWCFTLQSNVLSLHGNIKHALENKVKNSSLPLLRNIPLRDNFFAKLPFKKLNPLPKELLLFQDEILFLNNRIDYLNQICLSFNQLAAIRVAGVYSENIGANEYSEWLNSAENLESELNIFSQDKLREVNCSITECQDRYKLSKILRRIFYYVALGKIKPDKS